MIDWNGFDRGVIGKKLPSDKTLNNMRKADLIEYLHIAENNHNVLALAYKNAVDNSKCNKCPIPKMSAEHDKQIRAVVIDELSSIVLKELKEIAKDEDYFFDNDNLSLVSTVILTNAEKLKEAQDK